MSHLIRLKDEEEAMDEVTWGLVKKIMKAYGLKETGEEDENEKFSGFYVIWRDDEEFLRNRFVGGVRVWWREGLDAKFVHPGVMKRITTDEAILHCWPNKEALAKIQLMRFAEVWHVDVVHFYEAPFWTLAPKTSQPITDYTNVITRKFEGVRSALIAHLHAVETSKCGLTAECSYCGSMCRWVCKVCKVSMCFDKPECLNAHWKEIADGEESHPRFHVHDEFASHLFAAEYVATKKAGISCNKKRKHK